MFVVHFWWKALHTCFPGKSSNTMTVKWRSNSYEAWLGKRRKHCRKWTHCHMRWTLRHLHRLNGGAYLARSAGFSTVPATVCAAVPCEGGAATQQDVEDDPEAPKVTPLVVEGGLISEHLHYFWSHVLCWATLREGNNFVTASFRLTWFPIFCVVYVFSYELKTRLLPVLWALESLWVYRHCWVSLHFPNQNHRSLLARPE